jgi:hypothetical protein
MRTARLAGHYFNVLGTASILGMISGPILSDSLRIDLTFILFFWVGMGILDGRPWSRKVALIFTLIGLLITAGLMASLPWLPSPMTGARRELSTPLLAFIHGGIILLLTLPPFVLLLLPGTRRWFAEPREAPPTRVLTPRVIALYVLAACVPIAGGVALERLTRTVKPSGYCGSFGYGEGKTGMAAVQWMEDETTGRRLHISWLAFAESNSYGSPRDGYVTFGPHRISVPEDKPVRYLFTPPKFEHFVGNVLLVREDGTVIRLSTRLPPEQLEAAREAAHGVRDFEELRERLESLLPEKK